MSRLILISLMVPLLAACAAQPASLTPTQTTEATTEKGDQPATPTFIPQNSEYAEQVMQMHEMATFMFATIEVINETALRVSQDSLEESLAQSILARESAYAVEVEKMVAIYQPPIEFQELWDRQYAAYSKSCEIVNLWLAQEIDPDGAIEDLIAVREQSTSSLDDMDELVVRMFGIDRIDLLTHRAYYRSFAFENAFGHERTACSSADPVKNGTGKGDQLAFVSDRGGTSEIYLVNDDGTGLTLLTEEGLGAFHPAWSPDGEKIAFFSYRDGNSEIYVINMDGTGLTRLTANTTGDFDPSWSPDGTKIIFHTHRYGENPQVAVMNSDGTNVVQLTDQIGGWSPVYSPDGTQITFNSSYGPSRDIWIMDADGSDPTKITFASDDDWWPDWSPDGDLIVFHSIRDGNFEIYIVNPISLASVRLTNSPGGDYDPDWSPDGTRIAYSSEEGGTSEICIMNADGSGIVNLTENPAQDISAAWRP